MKKPLLLLALFLLASALWAQNRYALVIGNSKYPGVDLVLPNTIKDSADISRALGNLGYSVVLKNDLKQRDMAREIDAFVDRVKSNPNSEGFFWYAGHGMLINGENLLLPLDVETNTESMIRTTSISVTELTRQLSGARNRANVIVLDACRVPPRVGGGWGYDAQALRSAYRHRGTPSDRDYYIGFRIVRNG